jgi:hypothetical protein
MNESSCGWVEFLNELSNMGEENHWGEMGTLKTTMKMEISPFDRFVVVSSTVVDVDDGSSPRDGLHGRWRFGLADCGDSNWCIPVLFLPQNRSEKAYQFGSWDVPRRKLHPLLTLRSVQPS